MDVPVNYLAVLIAGVASMVIGFLWYSPSLFGKPWMKLMGHTVESMKSAQKKMGMLYGLSFVLSLVTAYVLTHVMVFGQSYLGYTPLMGGLSSAFWMWLGFVMPVQATDAIFGGKKWALVGINTGYQLAALLAMGFVIGLMG